MTKIAIMLKKHYLCTLRYRMNMYIKICMRSFTIRILTLITLIVSLAACTDIYFDEYIDISNPEITRPVDAERKNVTSNRRVFIMFAFGYNNLSNNLTSNIDTLEANKLPGYSYEDDIVLILSHMAQRPGYTKRTSPVLFRTYKNTRGQVTRDTLHIYADTTVATRKNIVCEVLKFAQETFPAKSYGALFSSHGTGWAPEGYCYSPPDKQNESILLSETGLDKYHDYDTPVKSIGAHYVGSAANSIEIEINDLAEAIPMKLDYIIFDACFMGGIEVAYALKDKCNKVCFSQAEILADGMQYNTLLSHLFDKDEPDIESVAADYFEIYDKKANGFSRSATISVVDCSKLDPLAEIVKKYVQEIRYISNTSTANQIQPYFLKKYSRYHGIFYDLEDILKKSGAGEEDLAELEKALKDCILCKYATDYILGSIEVRNFCGLSMYLPDKDRYILNDFYKTLKWNQATHLIE